MGLRAGQYRPGDTPAGRLKGKDYQFLLSAAPPVDPLDTEYRAMWQTAERLVEAVEMRGRGTRTGFGELSAFEALHKLARWVMTLDGVKQEQAVRMIGGRGKGV